MNSLFRALVAVCAMSMASGVSATVVVGDNIWRQVTDTLGFSWSDFVSVCDTTDGTCAGSLGGVDLTDWIWADTVELQTLLFDTLSSQPTFDPITLVTSADAPWASEFFELGFSASASGLADAVSGIVRDLPDDNEFVRRVTIQDGSFIAPDRLALENFGTNEFLSGVGGWFYVPIESLIFDGCKLCPIRTTPPASAPEPTTTALLALGLLGADLGVRRRRLN